jgi:hypothetical protein
MITIWSDDYPVVMAYVNQYYLDSFAGVGCKHPQVNEVNLAN